jgi:TctA family transporter
MVLAMVLGDKAEDAFRQSMIMSKGELSIFWTNSTLVACIMGLAMLLLFWPLISMIVKRLRRN